MEASTTTTQHCLSLFYDIGQNRAFQTTPLTREELAGERKDLDLYYVLLHSLKNRQAYHVRAILEAGCLTSERLNQNSRSGGLYNHPEEANLMVCTLATRATTMAHTAFKISAATALLTAGFTNLNQGYYIAGDSFPTAMGYAVMPEFFPGLPQEGHRLLVTAFLHAGGLPDHKQHPLETSPRERAQKHAPYLLDLFGPAPPAEAPRPASNRPITYPQRSS